MRGFLPVLGYKGVVLSVATPPLSFRDALLPRQARPLNSLSVASRGWSIGLVEGVDSEGGPDVRLQVGLAQLLLCLALYLFPLCR